METPCLQGFRLHERFGQRLIIPTDHGRQFGRNSTIREGEEESRRQHSADNTCQGLATDSRVVRETHVCRRPGRVLRAVGSSRFNEELALGQLGRSNGKAPSLGLRHERMGRRKRVPYQDVQASTVKRVPSNADHAKDNSTCPEDTFELNQALRQGG